MPANYMPLQTPINLTPGPRPASLNGPAPAAGPKPLPTPAQPGDPIAPSMAPPVRSAESPRAPRLPDGTLLAKATLPADTLEIGGQLFGKGVQYGDIRPLAAGLKPTDAAAMTANDGIDKVFFTDETGKSFVMYVEKGHFDDVRAGYLGRYNGKRIQVDAVDDENNTFGEGFHSVWNWLNTTLHSSFGSEASKSISGLVATSIGTFIAAAAIKTTAPVQTLALPAARGFLANAWNSAMGAVGGFINTMATVVLFALGAVGSISLFAGVRAYYRKGEYRTLDMVTGNY